MASSVDAPSISKRPEIPEISITTSTSNLNADIVLEPTSQLKNEADDSFVLPPSPPSLVIDGEDAMSPRGMTLHTRSPSEPRADPKLLSPLLTPILRPSTPPPSSPSPSDQGLFATIPPPSPSPSDQGSIVTFSPPSPSPSDHGSILTIPPSPTLSSHSSVHFQQPTTLSLRDNQPGSGLTSLKMLSPETAYNHRRRPSRASHTASVDESVAETELDSSQHLPLTPIGSYSKADNVSINTTSSPTTTAVGTMSVHAFESKGTSRSHRDSTETSVDELRGMKSNKGKEPANMSEITHIPEENMDPSPFYFNPSRLASLVDPKSLNSLTELGGVNGLIKGLGTNMHDGLSLSSLGQLPDLKADHVVDDGGGGDSQGWVTPSQDITARDAFAAALEDRKRIYGTNILPARRSKSLLLLMWLAFKDKVLVCIVIVLIGLSELHISCRYCSPLQLWYPLLLDYSKILALPHRLSSVGVTHRNGAIFPKLIGSKALPSSLPSSSLLLWVV